MATSTTTAPVPASAIPTATTTIPSPVLPSPTPTSVTAVQPLPVPAPTQPATDLPFVFESVAQLGGPIKDVIIAGDVVYLAAGLTLTVLDISDPASPIPVTEILLPNPAEDLYLVDDTLYALTQSQSINLLTFDVAAPANPIYRDTLPLTASEFRPRIVGYTTVPSRLYLSGQHDRLLLVDISHPQQPVEAGAIQFEQRLTGAAVMAAPSGPIYAYIGQTGPCRPASRGLRCDGILRVLDISDLTAPVPLASLETPAPPVEFVIEDDRVYLVEQHCDMDAGCHGGLEMITLSDPTKPRSLGFVEAWSRRLVVNNKLAVADNLQIWDLANLSPQPLTADNFEGQVAAVVDDYAFLFDQAKLQIVDISDPASPHDTGHFRSSGPVYPVSLAVSTQYLYVMDSARGLQIIDLTEPAAPREVGFIDGDTYQHTYHQIQRIEASRLYLSDDTAATLEIIDIGDPTRPKEAGQYLPTGWPVKAADSYAYVGTPLGLQIVDLTDPVAPTDVGFYDLPNAAGGGLWPLDGYVYLTLWEQGLQAVDLSTPEQPIPLGFYTMPSAYDLAIVEGYGYYTISGEGLQIVDLTNPAQAVDTAFLPIPGISRLTTVVNGVAYLLDEQGHLLLVDVSDPAAPITRGSYRGASFPSQILVEQDRPVSYLLHAGRGLISLDLSDPTIPIELGVLALPSTMAQATGSIIDHRLYIYNEYGYLGGNPVIAFDVSNPTTPVELGTSTPPGAPRKIVTATCAAQQDGMAYGYLQNLDNELVITDLSDPTNPLVLGKYRPATTAHFVRVFVTNCLVYLLDTKGTIWVIDVSDPSNPQVAAHHTHFPSDINLVTVNDYAYLSALQMTLRVIDISNPAQPQEVGVTGLGGGWVEQLEPAGERAYLLQNQADGLWLKTLDISDRANPTVLGITALSQTAVDQFQAATEQHIYLTDMDGNLVMLDLSNPNHPVEVGRYDAPGHLTQITLWNDYVVAAGNAGIQVLRLLTN